MSPALFRRNGVGVPGPHPHKLVHQGIARHEIDCCTAETSSPAVEQTTTIVYHAEVVPIPQSGFSIAFVRGGLFMKCLHLLQFLHPLKIKDSTRDSTAKRLSSVSVALATFSRPHGTRCARAKRVPPSGLK